MSEEAPRTGREYADKMLLAFMNLESSEFVRRSVNRAHVRSFFWSALIWLPLGFFIGWGMR